MPRRHRFEHHLLRTLRQQAWIAPGSRVLAAVSGGADSLALLYGLARLRPLLKIELVVATLDHGLRGADSAADAAYVAQAAQQLGVLCHVGQRDVIALAAAWGLGVEAAARRARYEFLAQVALDVGADCVLTGHHADDQAETVLMRLIRGAGLRGLRGMLAAAPLPYDVTGRLRLIRPLLSFRRALLRDYCASLGIAPRHDASNDDRRYLRNDVRSLLHHYPPLTPHLTHISLLAQIDEAYFAQAIAAQVGEGYVWDGQQIRIERATFVPLPEAFQLRIIAAALRRAAPDVEFSFDQIQRCRISMIEGHTRALELNAGWSLRSDAHMAVIARHAPPALDFLLPTADEIALVCPGANPIMPGCQLVLSLAPHPQAAKISIPPEAEVTLRGRRPGDRFAPPGLDGHRQKMKQWMIDRKIPQAVRDRVPLLMVNGEIAAIYWGGRWVVAHPFRPKNSADRSVSILILQAAATSFEGHSPQ